MTTEPLRPNLPEEEDSWTDLAEDLFGIDFAQAPQSGEFVSPEELLAEDDQTPSDTEAPTDPALAVETVEVEKSAEVKQFEDAEEFPLPEIEAETTAQDSSTSTHDMPEDAELRDEEEASARDRSADNATKKEEGEEDTFWDALNDWNWGDDKAQVKKSNQNFSAPERDRRKSPSIERQKPAPSRIVRQEDDFSSVEEMHDEYIDNSEFGAGLLKEEDEQVTESEVSESKVSESVDEQTDQSEETQPKAQRSRRRRRRPRKTTQETGETESASEGDENVEPNKESSDTDESPDQGDATEVAPRKRSRRRSSRGRKNRSESPAAESDSQTPAPAPAPAPGPTEESDAFGESILDDELEPVSEESSQDSGELESNPDQQAKAPHRDVPTWEEAISYLLSPKKVTEAASESKTSSSSTATKTKDSSDPSKPPARRRRRRRR